MGLEVGKAHAVKSHFGGVYVDINIPFSNTRIKVVGIISFFIVCRNHCLIDRRTCIVVCKSAGNCALAADIEVGAVVLHFRVEELLHGVDVAVSVDGFAVLPFCVGVKSDLPNVTLFGVLNGLTFGKIYVIFGKVVLVVSSYVGDTGSHFPDPLIYAVLRVENGHSAEGAADVASDGIISVGFPSMIVPVGAESSGVALIGISIGLCSIGRIVNVVVAVAFGFVAGCEAKYHYKSKKKAHCFCECAFHSEFPPRIFIDFY